MEHVRPYHLSIMPDAVVHYLQTKPGGVYVDATFGGGGHTYALLEADPTCTVIALDWDMVALEKNGEPLQEKYGERLQLVWANFAHIKDKLKKIKVTAVDGIIADFGT